MSRPIYVDSRIKESFNLVAWNLTRTGLQEPQMSIVNRARFHINPLTIP
jgi:hypothetical protein